MRRFLHLLTLVALLIAPLAAPATAMAAVKQGEVDCADMDMAASDHQMPAVEHRSSEPCCMAVQPAIDPPLTMFETSVEIDHLAFIPANELFRLGAGPEAEDPPPRRA